MDPIIKKQKCAIRIISRAPYNAHTEPLFKTQEILCFEDLYVSSILQFMHAYMQDKVPYSFHGIWVQNRYKNPATAALRAQVRTATELFIPKFRLQFAAKLPLHRFPKIWNEFTEKSIKNITNVNTFKSKLKEYFLEDLASVVKCNRPFRRDCFPSQLE